MEKRVAGLIACLFVSGCTGSGSDGSVSPPLQMAQLRVTRMMATATATTPLEHIVIMVQENRSFDNLFATFPGADGATRGRLHTGAWVRLNENDLYTWDVNHGYEAYRAAYDHGKMDGFDTVGWNGPSGPAGRVPYQYVDPAQIAPYWTLARTYALADRMFQTQGSGSFTAHQDLIAGGTQISSNRAIVDDPTGLNWGCDAWNGTVTSLVTKHGKLLERQGPFPCFTYTTIRDLLDARRVTWRYYTPPFSTDGVGALWNAFDAIRAVRYSSQWKSNVVSPETRIFADLRSGQLANVSWVIPDSLNSDHPQAGGDTGPSWIAAVVNAIGKSVYWKNTAILIVWDDWGGFYDHVPPPQYAFGGLGFRVPLIVVSPYARNGYIEHRQLEFGSILRFVEDNWSLGRLGTSDVRAASIATMFDFTKEPRAFAPVAAKYSQSYFERQRPSYRPVDDE